MDVVPFRAEWETALDQLEMDVELAEQLLVSATPAPPQPWQPPNLRGPMPDDLLPRARLLHERQLAAARDIALAAAATRRQVALTNKVTDTYAADVPVYLDITA
ncbi:MAG TPA: hypothetical protein VHG70_01020 [Nocardioidaceae bacterium]|nr:hypothetical protein [Nocardioidaceae bacterium]